MKYLRRLLLALIAVVCLGVVGVYIAGPHADVARAFERYRAAFEAGDRDLVTNLTAPTEIEFLDRQRKMALTASRGDVERLTFRERVTVLGLRKKEMAGELQLALLQNASAVELYSANLNIDQQAKALKPISVLFAVPTGAGHARGYLDLTGSRDMSVQGLLMSVMLNAYYRFVRAEDGTWLVDPSPAIESSAGENEHWAMQVEPTGNRYILEAVLGETDKARADVLWEPLVK